MLAGLAACSSTSEADPAADATPNPNGKTEGSDCTVGFDCRSGLCTDGRCAPTAASLNSSPTDGVKNGDETDVDCGGSKAPACADAKGCLVKSDCASGVCTAKVCQAPTSKDGVQNGDETGIDCGGSTTSAPKCPAGMGCLTNADCDKIKCDTVQKKCLPASHSDGIKNLDETGIDCGGPTAGVARCASGQGCAATSDCANVACNLGTLVCDPPSSTDGFKNGTETDVDCGGGAPTNAGPCALGKACLLTGDCVSTACNYAKKCVEGPSCNVHFGGDTCGKGEVGQVGAAHESCCTRLPLPANPTVSVGKYEITAGRVREFIKQTGGNVRGWVDNHRAQTTQIPDGVLNYLPEADKLPIRTYPACQKDAMNNWVCKNYTRDFGVYTHLGSTTIFPDRPCRNCGQGCWFNTGAGQNGHTTYWFDAATQSSEWGAGAKVAGQSELDVKSINCVTQVILAAFCAWDGGRLPTQAELGSVNGAWGPGGMPWGGSSTSFRDTVAGNEAGRIVYPFNQDGTCPGNSCFLLPMLTAAGGYDPAAATVNTTNFNPFPSSPGVFNARYVYPVPANTATNDQAYAIAAPGRMRNDFRFVGPGADDGYYDIAANLIEVTGTVTTFDNGYGGPDEPPGYHLDFNGNPLPGVSWVGGSFEGHSPNNRGGYDLDVLTKYGKAGGRCAYGN